MSNNKFFTVETESRKIFIQIPKQLMNRKSKYFELSPEAKLMYGVFLDKTSLSLENKWIDNEDRVYFKYSVENQMKDFGYGNQKIAKLNKELVIFGLLKKKIRGQGKSAIFYLLQMDVEEALLPKLYGQECENHISKDVKITSLEMLKSHGNNTKSNNTNLNKTNISSSKEKVEEEDSDTDLILKESSKINLKLSRKVVEQLLTGYSIKEILRVIAAINNPSEVKNVGAYMKKSLVENSKSINITKTTIKEVKPNGNFESRDIKNDEELIGWDE